MLKRLIIACLIGLMALPVAAQDTAQRVEVTASDGLVLVGTYTAPPQTDSSAPAALLLHQLGSNKESWEPLVPGLTEAGFGVLAVDMRGHGETGGSRNWPLAESDVQVWLDWLRDQPGIDPERLSIVGASIGSNLALRGMANDDRVVTAVALSPGLDYVGVTTDDAVKTIGTRPIYLVAGQRDETSANAVKALTTIAQGDTLARLYPHSAHGTGIFPVEEDLAPSIVSWLVVHSRP